MSIYRIIDIEEIAWRVDGVCHKVIMWAQQKEVDRIDRNRFGKECV